MRVHLEPAAEQVFTMYTYSQMRGVTEIHYGGGRVCVS